MKDAETEIYIASFGANNNVDEISLNLIESNDSKNEVQ